MKNMAWCVQEADSLPMQNSSQQNRTFVVDLAISADEFVRLYQGAARAVVARARNGQTVQFPANSLTRFVLHDGVHGSFRLEIDADNKLQSIDRIGQAGG